MIKKSSPVSMPLREPRGLRDINGKGVLAGLTNI